MDLAQLSPASVELPPWRPRRVRAGEWSLTALSDGCMRLDAGGMWGVVPAALWRAMTPADEDNRIPIALRPFLATRGDDVVVIEPGIGARWSPKWRHLYAIEQQVDLPASLAALGLAPEDVTHVVASHCHFDHIGAWVVERDGSGELAPLFPGARHFAPRAEIEAALHPDPVRRASYRAEDIAPLLEAGVLAAYDDGAELLPGLVAHGAYGHSDGVSVITFNESGEGDTAVFWADVVPTAHHAQPAYIMAYDIDQTASYASRTRWMERAAAEGWIGLLYHDVDHAFVRLHAKGARYLVEPIEGIAVELGD
jgi:glyoxylase-like metal-dependent hydrolase (beta-lactamase superfamily II)